MRQPTLSGIVQRRFVRCVNHRGQSVAEVVQAIGITPVELCRLIAGRDLARLPLITYYHLARWLRMPLANVTTLAGVKPRLTELVRLGMIAHGYRPTSAQDQITAAAEAGISVAVFRRALHGYATFTPSIRTCDRLAAWLDWTGYHPDDIAHVAGMVVRYRPDGRRVAVTPQLSREIKPYPCACGRAGCMVPAHVPAGPRRKWRSDACRMWAKRRSEREARQRAARAAAPRRGRRGRPRTAAPHHPPIIRFIRIKERPVPVRF